MLIDIIAQFFFYTIQTFSSEKEGNKKQVEDLATMLATHKSEAVYLRFLDYLDTDFDWLALQLKASLAIYSNWKWNTINHFKNLFLKTKFFYK